MKKLLLLALAFLFVSSVRAQSTSHTWIDVTASPYNATNNCSVDAGPAINAAIAGAPSGSGVIFFPTGCYLISTQIVDTNAAAWLSYLGEGKVQLRASSSLSPSIIQLGNDSIGIGYRKIEGLYFNCNNNSSADGIDIDGLYNSEFDDVTISSCNGTHLRTTGANINNYSNRFVGGSIYAAGSYGNGVSLGSSANSWSFYGTRIVGLGNSSGNANGVGIDFEGYGGGLFGGEASGWTIGVWLQGTSNVGVQRGGQEISGSYITNNATAIRAGNAGGVGQKAVGFTIAGNFINCNNLAYTTGISLDQASGFSVTSNQIRQCTTSSILGRADGTNVGADNGLVRSNVIDGGVAVSLLGSNNTVASSLSTVSANYTLNGADSWINVIAPVTITVPLSISGQQWKVFSAFGGNVTLVCSGGTINGAASVSLANLTGKTVSTDGTNCFAF